MEKQHLLITFGIPIYFADLRVFHQFCQTYTSCVGRSSICRMYILLKINMSRVHFIEH